MDSVDKIELDFMAILKGYFNDIRNDVDLSFSAEDMCYMTVYHFGVSAALYAISKNPKRLSKFLAKYNNMNDTSKFSYPTNIDKNKIEDVTILTNAFLELCKVITSKDKQEAMKKAPKDLFEDMLDLFGEIFPKYARGEKVDIMSEYSTLFHPNLSIFKKIKDNKITKVSGEEVLKLFALTNHEICLNMNVDPTLLNCTYSLPINNSNSVRYVSYVSPVYKFGQNPSNYMGHKFASTKKCKDFPDFLNEMDEYKDKELDKVRASNLPDEKKMQLLDEIDDCFVYEITSLLLMNGFSLYEDISKSDVLNALQVRTAMGKYNGNGDENDYNKFVADVVVSMLARKIKQLSLNRKETNASSARVYVDENKEVKILEEKNAALLAENKTLQEKLNQVKRKDNKEDARINSLELKIKELEELLQEKEQEIDALESRVDTLEGEINDANNVGVEIDYHSVLKAFTEENSVIIVGGNYNLISKMKGVLPEITYIMDSEKSRITDEIVRNASIVLFKTDSLGHSSFENVTSKCDRFDVPYGFLKNLTNTKALEQNIAESIQNKIGSLNISL